MLTDVQGASLRHVVAPRAGTVPRLVLRDVRDLTVQDSAPLKSQVIRATKAKDL